MPPSLIIALAAIVILSIGFSAGFLACAFFKHTDEEEHELFSPGEHATLKQDVLHYIRQWRHMVEHESLVEHNAADDTPLVSLFPSPAARLIHAIEHRCKRVESHEKTSDLVPTNG